MLLHDLLVSGFLFNFGVLYAEAPFNMSEFR
jgi:hypothetical protein